MSKRALNPPNCGKMTKAEELNRAIDAMFSGKNEKPPEVIADLMPLARLAGELRDLPRPEFKARLKFELQRSKSMATVAEPVTAVHAKATPRLVFKDAAKAIEFYKQAFGAKETFRFETEQGIGYASLAIGDSMVSISEEWPAGGRFSAETLGHSAVVMRLQVDDVDGFVAKAMPHGLTGGPLADTFYGHRAGNFLDPFGYSWEIFAVREQVASEEMHRRFRDLTKGPEGRTEPKEGERPVSPIRPGFRMITPYVVAQDGPAMLEFVKQAFGAEETFRAVGPAGGVHGEVRLGDSMLMIGGGIPGKEFHSTANTHALHVYVQDADSVYRKALAAGATSIDEPRDQEYGERSASVKDRAGNFWYIATFKGNSYVAKGLNVVNPYLHPLRAEPLISFLKRAFGAQELAKHASPDGVVHHAEIRVGDSVLEMGEAHGKYQPMSPMFYVYVANTDDAYRRALAAGAISVQEPRDQPYGDRNAGVKDAFGNTWFLATHVKDM